jgi:hypothetical protein
VGAFESRGGTRSHNLSICEPRKEELSTCNMLGPCDGGVVRDAHTRTPVSKWDCAVV